MPTIRHAPSFPIFTTPWSPALYDEKHFQSGIKWYDASESTAHVDSSLTRCNSLSSVISSSSSSLVVIADVPLFFEIFFGLAPSDPPLSLRKWWQFFWRCPHFPQSKQVGLHLTLTSSPTSLGSEGFGFGLFPGSCHFL